MKAYIFIIVFITAINIFSQNPYLLHYTTSNSPLPNNTIKEVLADTNDNIWMTTSNGLVKYASGNWEIFNTSNSGIYKNNLSDFYIDNKNNIWFCGYTSDSKSFFQKFDGLNWINEDTTNSLSSSLFAVDDNGGKWFFISAGFDHSSLVHLINGDVNIYTENDIGIRLYVPQFLFVDKNDRLWIIGEDDFSPMGISYFSESQWHTTFYSGYPVVGGYDIDYKNGLLWNSQTINSYAGFTTYDYNDLSITQRFNAINEPGFHFANDVRIDTSAEKLFVLKKHYSSSYSRLDCFNTISGDLQTLFEIINESCEDLEIDKYMNKYVTGADGLYIINEEGIIYNKSIAHNRNLQFDSTHVDSISSKSFWIFNPYDSLMTIDSIKFTSSDFILTDSFPNELNPLDSIELHISFHPLTAGIFLTGLDVYDNYAKHTINLLATGYGITNLENVINQRLKFELSQNYPNPFNPSTTISWQSPVGSWQTLKVYDVLGNEVATLVNEYRNAGGYEVNFDANRLASGVYYYQLKAGNFIQTKKMIYLK